MQSCALGWERRFVFSRVGLDSSIVDLSSAVVLNFDVASALA